MRLVESGQTNGKAERFIQSARREWAYGQAYRTSDERAGELPYWMPASNTTVMIAIKPVA